ncbi:MULTISPECIES: hypothetical protein [Alphaproteobacteria]|uniref:hypothetical protein n=1 Tax=Alphaproteobacteria TaxID=28211 RepID=UPI0011BF24E8|nr:MULTISPECIES: hypothetical protein [Alphaproteobacteria]
MTRMISGTALALLWPMAMAFAGGPPAPVGFKALEGKCVRVVAGDEDLTAGCNSKLGIISYADGRTGFYFLLSDNRILTFSGFGKARDRNTYGLDRVVYNDGTGAAMPRVVPASGSCAYGNPYKGPVTVRCKGRTPQGEIFAATFRSNGKPPKQ